MSPRGLYEIWAGRSTGVGDQQVLEVSRSPFHENPNVVKAASYSLQIERRMHHDLGPKQEAGLLIPPCERAAHK